MSHRWIAVCLAALAVPVAGQDVLISVPDSLDPSVKRSVRISAEKNGVRIDVGDTSDAEVKTAERALAEAEKKAQIELKRLEKERERLEESEDRYDNGDSDDAEVKAAMDAVAQAELQTQNEIRKLQHQRERLERMHKPRNPLRFKFEVQGMDSVLKGLDTLFKHLPIPNEIEIDDNSMRFSPPKWRDEHAPEEPPVTERGGIVRFGGDVVVGRNERVSGDVVVFFGNVVVYGVVEGSVVTFKGDIKLASTAEVESDVVSIWGNAEAEEGAQAGQTNVLNFGRLFQKTFSHKPSIGSMAMLDAVRIAFLLLVAVLILAAFPKNTRAVGARLRGHYAKSLLVGLLSALLLPVVFLMLLVTIIGIPVALLGLPVLVVAALLMGGTAVAFRIGELVRDQAKWKWESPLLLVAVGMLLLEGIGLFGKIAGQANPVLGQVFLLVNGLIFTATWMPGFGAVVLTRFGTRPKAEPLTAGERKKVKA
jgi:hypothetical protein